MIETIDWKREKIGDYRALSAIVAMHEESIRNDPEIATLLEEEDRVLEKINKITKDRNITIEEAKREQSIIKMELMDHWDIDSKKYSCDVGSAVMRTKKTLILNNLEALIEWLHKFEILPFAIKTLDIPYIRKLKDALKIPDAIARYDESTSVAIGEPK